MRRDTGLQMFASIEPLREPLLAARLLREEILAMPVPPGRRDALRARYPVRADSRSAPVAALAAGARIGGAAGFLEITREELTEVATLAGATGLRRGGGEPFHGQPAPPPDDVAGLFDEILGTVNAPRAVEGWSPVLRAYALHFLLRLVQPFEGPPAAIAHAAEAMVLASDGFDAGRMQLGGAANSGRDLQRPDPDAFSLDRAHVLVEALGNTRDAVRAEAARALLRQWAVDRASGLNLRQRAALAWLDEPERVLDFREYVTLNAVGGAASLRSLQRDWRGLREAGWIVDRGEGQFALSTAPLEWGSLAD